MHLGPFSGKTAYVFDPDGKLRVELDEISRALEGVDATRIRECEVCRRIFWAGRIDMVCCSHRCGNVRTNRLHRAKHKVQLF